MFLFIAIMRDTHWKIRLNVLFFFFFPYYPSLDITGKTAQCASVCDSIFIRYAFQVRCAQKKLIVVLT